MDCFQNWILKISTDEDLNEKLEEYQFSKMMKKFVALTKQYQYDDQLKMKAQVQKQIDEFKQKGK